MKHVHIHPDEKVIIKENNQVLYADTIVNFELDYGVSLDQPIGQWNELLYVEGQYCRWADGFTEEIKNESWTMGDDIITNLATIIANKEAREAVVEE